MCLYNKLIFKNRRLTRNRGADFENESQRKKNNFSQLHWFLGGN